MNIVKPNVRLRCLNNLCRSVKIHVFQILSCVFLFCSRSFIISYISGESIDVNIGLVFVLKSTEYSYLLPNFHKGITMGSLGDHSWKYLRRSVDSELRKFEGDRRSFLLTMTLVLPQVTLR